MLWATFPGLLPQTIAATIFGMKKSRADRRRAEDTTAFPACAIGPHVSAALSAQLDELLPSDEIRSRLLIRVLRTVGHDTGKASDEPPSGA